MKTRQKPRIQAADRLRDGIIITFDDGKAALYSADLLREILPKAEEVEEEPE